MRLSLLRVPAHHPARGAPRRAAQPARRPDLSRSLLGHVAWSAIVLAAAALLIGIELSAPCPRGGPIAFGSCTDVRPLAVGVVGLAAILYVGGLSAVRWWTASLLGRGVADARAARDWYLLAAVLGMPVAALLAFTLVSGLR